jgi:hypothetical protein
MIEIQNSPYCKTGLGVGSPECCDCKLECKERRVLNGGPDIASEMTKAGHSGNAGSGLIIPDSVKTKVDLSRYLDSILKRGTPEYKAAYAEFSGSFEMGKH